LLDVLESEPLFSDEAELLAPELSDLLSGDLPSEDLLSEDEDSDPLPLEELLFDDFFA
jgi:hypothetical protein